MRNKHAGGKYQSKEYLKKKASCREKEGLHEEAIF